MRGRPLTRLLALAVIALLNAPQLAFADPLRKTVCELDGSLKEFESQEVIIDAEYIEFYHGQGLKDRSCPKAIVFVWIDYKRSDLDPFLAAWAQRPTLHEIAATFTGRVTPHVANVGFGDQKRTLLFLDLTSAANWHYVPRSPAPER